MGRHVVTRRRSLQAGTAVLGLCALAGGGMLALQSPLRTAGVRLGFLGQTIPLPMYRGLNEGLRELGYVEGENLTIEYRYAEGKFERLPELAAELVRLNVDIMVVAGNLGAFAAKSATTTIPIVMALSTDPVGFGIVASLSRPGGNVTGLSQLSPTLTAKRLELLRETIPGISRVAVMSNAHNPGQHLQWVQAEAVAQASGLRLQLLEVRGSDDFAPAFQAAVRAQAEAMFLLDDALFPAHRPVIIELAFLHRLPLTYSGGEEARLGALLGYGPNIPEHFRRAATFVDKILKGAKPADLPIEQSSRFDFVVNLRTAQSLGLTIPPSVIHQATEIIQ